MGRGSFVFRQTALLGSEAVRYGGGKSTGVSAGEVNLSKAKVVRGAGGAAVSVLGNKKKKCSMKKSRVVKIPACVTRPGGTIRKRK